MDNSEVPHVHYWWHGFDHPFYLPMRSIDFLVRQGINPSASNTNFCRLGFGESSVRSTNSKTVGNTTASSKCWGLLQ